MLKNHRKIMIIFIKSLKFTLKQIIYLLRTYIKKIGLFEDKNKKFKFILVNDLYSNYIRLQKIFILK